MTEKLTQRTDAGDEVLSDPDGWHELSVANPAFLLERLVSQSTDLQGLTVAGLDAITAPSRALQSQRKSGRLAT
jgi:hypothetical protein